MALSDTAGNYRCIYQKLSVFIEYHSLVGQVNLYICISDIIGISAKSAVSIYNNISVGVPIVVYE